MNKLFLRKNVTGFSVFDGLGGGVKRLFRLGKKNKISHVSFGLLKQKSIRKTKGRQKVSGLYISFDF